MKYTIFDKKNNWIHCNSGCYEDIIKSFLQEDISREIVIENHVSGHKVSIKHSTYGVISFATGSRPPYPHMALECILLYNENLKKKESERIKMLSRQKSEIQKELERVSSELKNIQLSSFEKNKE